MTTTFDTATPHLTYCHWHHGWHLVGTTCDRHAFTTPPPEPELAPAVTEFGDWALCLLGIAQCTDQTTRTMLIRDAHRIINGMADPTTRTDMRSILLLTTTNYRL